MRRSKSFGVGLLIGAVLAAIPATGQLPALVMGPSVSLIGQPVDAVTGDFNGDGRQDIAVLLAGSGLIEVLTASGGGGFAHYASVTGAASAPLALAVDFLNLDAIPDFVVGSSTGNTVTVLVSNGPGTWIVQSTLALPAPPRRIATGDFNQDGLIDLAVASSTATGGDVRVYLATPGGGWSLTYTWTAPNAASVPTQLRVADQDGDGWLDLLVLRNGQGMFRHHNDHQGGFGQPITIALTGASFNDIQITDVDGDSNPDLAVTFASSTFSPSAALTYLGDGAGGFTPAGGGLYSGAAGGALGRLAVMDLDRDGVPDLVIGTGGANQIEAFLGDGAGGINPAASPFPLGFAADLVLPINADQDLDTDLVVFDRALPQLAILHNTATLARGWRPRIGTTFSLALDQPSDAGFGFVMAAALSASPPTYLPDTRAIPLAIMLDPVTVDPVFTLSTTPGGYGIFTGFSGALDAAGRATALVNVPNLPGIAGQSLVFAAVTLSATASLGIATITNPQFITLTN